MILENSDDSGEDLTVRLLDDAKIKQSAVDSDECNSIDMSTQNVKIKKINSQYRAPALNGN